MFMQVIPIIKKGDKNYHSLKIKFKHMKIIPLILVISNSEVDKCPRSSTLIRILLAYFYVENHHSLTCHEP